MKYLKEHELEITRWMFGGCMGLLLIAGFLLRCLGWGESLWTLAVEMLLPLVLAAGLYCAQMRFALLDQAMDWAERTKMLAFTGPLVLAAVGVGLYLAGVHVEIYMSIAAGTSMCLVLKIWDDWNRMKSLLLTIAVSVGFIWASAYTHCPGAMIVSALVGLTLQCINHHYWTEEPWALRGRATNWLGLLAHLAVIFLCTQVPYLRDAFTDSLMNFVEREEVSMAEDAAKMVHTYAKLAGNARLLVDGWIHRSGNGLLYILSRGGWLAVVPLVIAMVATDVAGTHLFGLCRYDLTYPSCLAALILGVILACDVLRLFGYENMLRLGSALFLGGFGSNLLTLVLAVILMTAAAPETAEFEDDIDDYDEPEVV